MAAMFLQNAVFILCLCGFVLIGKASPPKPLVRPPGKVLLNSDDLCRKLHIKCVHGTCVNDTSPMCECNQGWQGSACDTCGGRISLTDLRGHITDGHNNYTIDMKCTWLLEAPKEDQIIRLRFLHFATECSWDHLYIYNGDSVNSPQLAAYSGLMTVKPGQTDVIAEMMTQGHALLHFYSDAAYNMSGFNISYNMEPGSCPLDCFQRGNCVSGSCVCNDGWFGDGCQHERCPNNCSPPNGECTSSGCDCENSHGLDCSIEENSGYWEELLTINEPSPRASHKYILHENYLYVFFGYDFNNDPHDIVTRLDLETLSWENVAPAKVQEQREEPSPRYGHSVDLHKSRQKVYMFGGLLLESQETTHEFWEYNLLDGTWKKPIVNSGHIIPVVGHSANIVNDAMFVFFGHNPTFGYLNNVQIYNFTDMKWSVIYGQGVAVNGGYGHTSVYDPNKKLIYVHAGYVSTSSSTYTLSDYLYVFNPEAKAWSVRAGSGQPMFLHSAVFINDVMYVFGGNTHNDTNISQGAKCYSTNFYAYEPKCDSWMMLPAPLLHTDIARYGHIAAAYKEEMYLFGGFNGQVLNDVYKYTPASCTTFKMRTDCLFNKAGVVCVWDEATKLCMTKAAARSHRDIRAEVHTCEPTTSEYAQEQCNRLLQCTECVDSRYECFWCEGTCLHKGQDPPEKCADKSEARNQTDCDKLYPTDTAVCSNIHNCEACKLEDSCEWSGSMKSPSCTSRSLLNKNEQHTDASCSKSCHTIRSCQNCTANACMWCGNIQRCVESISYVASFPYGQCMEWTTQSDRCPETSCAGLRTCADCHSSPACGWCDDGSNTGLGQCMDGGLEGPFSTNHMTCSTGSWFFKHCPDCQCNGHSQCLNGTGLCADCSDHTTGKNCENCEDGYYGTATNGGNCTACDCNGQADTCHRETGKCFCHTRGVKGDKCDYCDEQNEYKGDPKSGGTCYYDTNTNFKYTFNLADDKEESKYQTHINFRNEPPESDRDVDFSINCSGKGLMNITMTSKETDGEVFLYVNKPCALFEEQFSHKQYHFGGDSNFTFYIYVFNFTTPFIVEISFLQIDPIDLIHFFITFFSCFLSLLLIAAIVWKIKQKCDLYRRRQRMVVEMEQMASRPFATCNLDLPAAPNQPLLRHEYITNTTASIRSSQRYKKGGANCPSPITLEPLAGNKAAVLSLLIRLPTGDEDFAPPSQPGLAVGSALVTIGNHRRISADTLRADKNTKPRKPPNSDREPPDNCI